MATKEKKNKEGETILEEAQEMFALAQEAEEDNRKNGLDDLTFSRLSEQWPEEVKRQRDREGRPCLTVNRCPGLVRQVVNEIRQANPSIKVHPADSNADPTTAEVISDLIRNIEYTSDASTAYDTAVDFAVTMGFGYYRVNIEYSDDDVFDKDIVIERIANPFSVYGDPYSEAADSSDWNTCFVTTLMSCDEFEAAYPKAAKTDWDDLRQSGLSSPWLDGEQVMVAEYWVREEIEAEIVQLSNGNPSDAIVLDADKYAEMAEFYQILGFQVSQKRKTKRYKVKQYVLNGAEVLSETEWPGKYIPIVPVYGEEINVEGKRHFKGIIRDLKDSQRMLNFWRTASTELVALAPKAPFIGPKGSFNSDADKWATANTVSHAYIEYDGAQPPQRQAFAGPPAGAIQEAMTAQDDLKAISGIYDSAVGAQSNEVSGRAILAREQQTQVGTFHYQDNLARAIRHTGRILIDLIPKVYSGPRLLRVMSEDKKPRNVPVNQGQQQPMPGAELAHVHDLTTGKYDVTVETGPGYTTKRTEAANQMIELIRAVPQSAQLIGDILIKNLDWPGADEIAKRLEAMAQQQQANPQLQAAQAQVMQLTAAINVLEQQLATKQAEKQIDMKKVEVDAFNAETNRLKVVQTGMDPQQVQALVLQTIQQVLASPDVLPMNPPMPPAPPPAPPQGGLIVNQTHGNIPPQQQPRQMPVNSQPVAQNLQIAPNPQGVQ